MDNLITVFLNRLDTITKCVVSHSQTYLHTLSAVPALEKGLTLLTIIHWGNYSSVTEE